MKIIRIIISKSVTILLQNFYCEVFIHFEELDTVKSEKKYEGLLL